MLNGFAIGYLGDPGTLDEDMRASEMEVRTRKPLEETVFSSSWEMPAEFLQR